MTRKTKTLLGGLAVVGLLITAIGIPIVYRHLALSYLCQTGGVAPLPPTASDVALLYMPFRFEATASFRAPLGDIQEWLRQSPVLKDVPGERLNDGRMQYRWHPSLETVVIVDESTGRVEVYVSGPAP